MEVLENKLATASSIPVEPVWELDALYGLPRRDDRLYLALKRAMDILVSCLVLLFSLLRALPADHSRSSRNDIAVDILCFWRSPDSFISRPQPVIQHW